ncbi:MAG: aminoglycoside adenylyltransferase domain-containing protein [Patescibacteria group bacterium]
MRKTHTTPYPELDVVLESHAEKIQQALGDNIIGFYSQGSLAIGDFDLTSDVDFVVITKEDLKEDQVHAVQKVHTQTCSQDSRWVKHLEYSFFPLQLFRTHSSPYTDGSADTSEERKLWYFDNGSPVIEKSDHDNTLVTRWTVRKKGKAVMGPDPKILLSPIHPDDLRREIRGTLIGWGSEVVKNPDPFKNRFYQAYFVLNYCRVLQDLEEGRITSKLEGVNWAKQHVDPTWIPLIDYCWKERQDPDISIGQPADSEIYDQVIDFVQYAIDKGMNFQIGIK